MLRRHTWVGTGMIVLMAGCWTVNGDAALDDPAVGDEASIAPGTTGFTEDGAVELPALALSEAIRIARSHNPRLLAARAQIEVSDGKRVAVGLWENPELEVYSEEIPVNSGGISAAKNMVGISQTIPFPGKKSLERKAADLSIEQSRNAYLAAELEVIRDVRIAFYRAVAMQNSVEIFGQLSELARSLATTSEKRLSAGEAQAQELLRAEIEWQRASADMEKARGDLAEARQRLATILGLRHLHHPSLLDVLSSKEDDAVQMSNHDDVTRHHPRMKQALLTVQEAEAVYDRSRKEYLPDVTLEVAYGRIDSDEEGSEDLAELSVSFPLPLINRGQGERRMSSGELVQARAHLAQTEQEVSEQLRNAMTRLQTATTRVNTYRDGILPKTDRALSLMQRGFERGKFSFIDLLDTQRTAAETRLDYQDALFELHAANATLDSLLSYDEVNGEEK